jgi:hypothetical protein
MNATICLRTRAQTIPAFRSRKRTANQLVVCIALSETFKTDGATVVELDEQHQRLEWCDLQQRINHLRASIKEINMRN